MAEVAVELESPIIRVQAYRGKQCITTLRSRLNTVLSIDGMPVPGTYSPRRVYRYKQSPARVGWRWALASTVVVVVFIIILVPGALTSRAVPIPALGFFILWFMFAWVSTLYRRSVNKPRWEWVALVLTPFGLFVVLFSLYLTKSLMTTVARTVISTLMGTRKPSPGTPLGSGTPERGSENLSPAEIYVRNLLSSKRPNDPEVIPIDQLEPVPARIENIERIETQNDEEAYEMDSVQRKKLRNALPNGTTQEAPAGLKMELRTKFLLLGIPLTLLAGLTTFVVIFYLSGGFQ